MSDDHLLKVTSNGEQASTETLSCSQTDMGETSPITTISESTPLINSSTPIKAEHHERHGTILSSIFTLVSTMIGGGVLSLPFAFQQGGFVMSSLVLIFVLMASTHGGFLIINSKKYCQGRIKNVEDVGRIAFGYKGEVLTQLVLIVTLFLCSVAYWILITDQLQPLFFLMCGPNSFWAKKIVVLTIPVLVIFPFTLLKSMSALKFTSFLSVFCVMFLAGGIVHQSVESHIGGRITRPDNPVKWWPKDLGGFLTSVSITGLTFACHFNILPMHSELRYQTRQNKRIILYSAMAITYCLNVVVSFFGFMQFRKYVDQDITKNYPHDNVVLTIGRCALALTLLLSFPLLIFPCRDVINRLIWKEHAPILATDSVSRTMFLISNDTLSGPSRIIWLAETVFLVFFSYVLAYYIPQVAMVWGFVGAIGTTLTIYILPPAFYLRVRLHPSRPDLKQVAAWGLMLVGILVLIVCTYQSFVNVINPIPAVISHATNISVTDSS
ncbi:probable sodium-coupled neutral amino acid transporter 6 [Nematostella vectensis]|uniref:probable sodium-coupled neutral amino acid transporter 6 n=1 Tax=Nematostella vectensis TaxID=45351 RepID=UPI00138FDFDF|nr:probable sodium-coupled neutral amino acid transporter 6 [Nematostella vectensis]